MYLASQTENRERSSSAQGWLHLRAGVVGGSAQVEIDQAQAIGRDSSFPESRFAQ